MARIDQVVRHAHNQIAAIKHRGRRPARAYEVVCRMNTVFESKRDAWIVILIWGVVLVCGRPRPGESGKPAGLFG
jgi:hypothetical protein